MAERQKQGAEFGKEIEFRSLGGDWKAWARKENGKWKLFRSGGGHTVERKVKGEVQKRWYVSGVLSNMAISRIPPPGEGNMFSFSRLGIPKLIGAQRRSFYGYLHRDPKEGPAIEGPNFKEWWVNGECVEKEDEKEHSWLSNGVLHRIGGPARISRSKDHGWETYCQLGRRHREDGPASVHYEIQPDGTKVVDHKGFYLFGHGVNPKLIESPEELTRKDIEALIRLDVDFLAYFVRRHPKVLLEKMGAQKMDESEYGTLWRIDRVPRLVEWRVIEWQDKVLGPDGKLLSHFRGVPVEQDGRIPGTSRGQRINTALDATAWTYGMTGEEYARRLTKRT